MNTTTVEARFFRYVDVLRSWSVTFILAVILLFIGQVTWDTVVTPDDPIKTTNDRVFASLSESREWVTIVYENDVTVYREFSGHVSRYVLHATTGDEIVLPESDNLFRPGKKRMSRVFYVPAATMRPGRWCLYALLTWKPRFSISNKTYESPAVCFELKKP